MEPALLTLKKDQTVTKNFKVARSDATINVNIVDQNGEAISNVWGWANARRKGCGFGPMCQQGSGINRGTAAIGLFGGYTYIVGMHVDQNMGLSLLKEVTVDLKKYQTKDVTLTLVPNDATVRIILKDQNGKQIRDADCEGFLNDENFGWYGQRMQDGVATIDVRGGRQYGYGYHCRPESGILNTLPGENFFLVKQNATVTKIATAYRSDASVKVTLKAPNGTNAKFGWVGGGNWRWIEDEPGLTGDLKGGHKGVIDTGTDCFGGTCTLPLVAYDENGCYELFAGTPPDTNWMPPEETIVCVQPGDQKQITLKFREPDENVAITAKLEGGGSPMWGFCWGWNEDGGFTGSELMDGVASLPVAFSNEPYHIGCDGPGANGKFFRSEETSLVISKAGNYSLDFTLVEEEWELPDGISQTIDVTAATTINLPDGSSVSIPANAAGSEGNAQFIASPQTNLFKTQNEEALTFGWNFEMTLQTDNGEELVESFNSPVTICLAYNADVLANEGLVAKDLIPKNWNEDTSTWTKAEGYSVDEDNEVICFQAEHFSNYANMTTNATVTSAVAGEASILATPASAGGPQVIIADEDGNVAANFFAYNEAVRVGIEAVTGDVNGDGEYEIVTAPGVGGGPHVMVFDHAGTMLSQFMAYDANLRMGVHVRVADLDGDGTDEIITSPMAGAGPQVRIFNMEGVAIDQFFAYAENVRTGLTVEAGDVNGDGNIELVTVPDGAAGPQVRVFDNGGNALATFFAFASTIRHGYNVDLGDLTGDGTADIVVSPKFGAGPQYGVFTGDGTLVRYVFAYDSASRVGLNLAVGDVNGDGSNEVVTVPAGEAGPQVRVFNADGNAIAQWFAYGETIRGSYDVLAVDLDNDGDAEVVTAPGVDMGPQVRTFDGAGNALSQFFTHHEAFRGGLHIAPAQ